MTKDNPKEQSLTPEYPDSPTVEVDVSLCEGTNCDPSFNKPPRVLIDDGTDPEYPHAKPLEVQIDDGTDPEHPHAKPGFESQQ